MHLIGANRNRRRHGTEGEEQEGYFSAISDLLVGILFIFILLLTSVVVGSLDPSDDTRNLSRVLEAERERAMGLANDLAATQQALSRREHDLTATQQSLFRTERNMTAVQQALFQTERDLTVTRGRLTQMMGARTAEQARYTENKRKRAELLRRIVQTLRNKQFEVVADEEEGILRLPDSLLFESGGVQPGARGMQTLKELAEILEREVRCAVKAPDCPPGSGAFLEAVFVEGHSDDLPVRSGQHSPDFADNWRLSTRRALEAFSAMKRSSPGLEKLTDAEGRSVFAISGYAAGRQIVPNISEKAREQNRRIELRFLLANFGKAS